MSKMRIYLAGPITGQTYAEATDWREQFAKSLDPEYFALANPMRGKHYLQALHKIEATEYGALNVLSAAKGIVARDRNDVRTADLVIANFLTAPERASLGTAIEFGWADAWRVPILSIVDAGNIHKHAMLMELSGWVVPTVQEAIDIVNALVVRAHTKE